VYPACFDGVALTAVRTHTVTLDRSAARAQTLDHGVRRQVGGRKHDLHRRGIVADAGAGPTPSKTMVTRRASRPAS